ncbi:MAG: PEP-utilizing enzyme, partial [Pseudomonadota bacterium]
MRRRARPLPSATKPCRPTTGSPRPDAACSAASLDKGKVLGLVLDTGGHTSHSVIMARSLGIPAVAGLHDATELIDPNDDLIVDGYDG